MLKLAIKIAIPVILVSAFAILALIATGQELRPSMYALIFLIAVFVFFAGLAIGQSLSSPVKELLDKAVELSEGNLSTRVNLETKDELADLARIFNKIAEELQASHEQEANIEKSVGIKVKAKTKELEETINALEQKVKNRTIELERLIDETNKLKGVAKNKEVNQPQKE